MRKKLIEVALPLDAINEACVRDKDTKTGHIRNLHKWFAPMPLPAWRAILFASIVDDPGEHLSEPEAHIERARLFRIIEKLVSANIREDGDFSLAARAEIAKQLRDSEVTVLDPFCGGGSTCVEAQRLGLRTVGADLNPVPVTITRALCEFPQRFANKQPVRPGPKSIPSTSPIAGFVEDIEYYADVVIKRIADQIGHLYPPASDGTQVLAWRWAWAVRSSDPTAQGAYTPMVSEWVNSRNQNNPSWIVPVIDRTNHITYEVRSGGGTPPTGTVGKGIACLLTGTQMPLSYIRAEGKAGRLRPHMLGMICDTSAGRKAVPPSADHQRIAFSVSSSENPTLPLPDKALSFRVQEYGFKTFGDLFLPRQATAIAALADAVAGLAEQIRGDASAAGWSETDSNGYMEAITTFLALCVDKVAQSNNVLVQMVSRSPQRFR